MKQTTRSKRQRRWLFSVVALMIIGLAAAGWYYLVPRKTTAEAQSTPTLQTAKVRTGDITITAAGTGNLLPASEVALAFRSGGVIAEVPVQVGDLVTAGQVLARLDDADVAAQVAQAEASVRLAELKLADLMAGADAATVATAEAALAAAEADLAKLREPIAATDLTAATENLRSAQAALAALSTADPEKLAAAQAGVTLAEIAVRTAQSAYDKVDPAIVGQTKQASDLWQATTTLEKAQADYADIAAGAAADALAAA
jgi:multidrug efflux pump subunit AcrA (membrane-fusion protein)